jgi:hypothetical protein
MSAEVQVRSPTSPASQDDKGDEKSPKLERKRGSVSKIKVARDKSGKESSFAETLAARPERSLSEKYSIDSSIPASVVEWSVSIPTRSLRPLAWRELPLFVQIFQSCRAC